MVHNFLPLYGSNVQGGIYAKNIILALTNQIVVF